MKKFNVTGTCYPEQHYMVDISKRLEQISAMVHEGDYFCINRARQYGKTTTLALLKRQLEEQYAVFSISFEGIGTSSFETDEKLSAVFVRLLYDTVRYQETRNLNPGSCRILERYRQQNTLNLLDLSDMISELCSKNDREIVLFVDEVDQASNYQSFLGLLGLLRDKYLKRYDRPTFLSVVLAGVYDIKNLKLKIRTEQEHQYNSPWNIASDFSVSMDFTSLDISGMLQDYEQDHRTGMNVPEMSELLYDYTSGYPFLVCRLCKILDEKVSKLPEYDAERLVWTKQGFLEAEKILLAETNTLFDDMRKKLWQYSELYQTLYSILYEGKSYPYNSYHRVLDIAMMFGYIRIDDGKVAVANRIFETWLYNLFVSEASLTSEIYSAGSRDKNQFIENGHLNVRRILEKFIEHYHQVYGNETEAFHEKEGRKYFMFYLKPIINGTGNYYVEPETRDETRADLVIDYRGEQYVIEMKIWHGQEYNSRGEQQLLEYMEHFNVQTGYMLSFNFNKTKVVGVQEVQVGDRVLIEAVV